MVINNKKYIISVSLITIILFTAAFAIINFEQKHIEITNNLIKTINTKSSYEIKTSSKPKLSIFPWVGVEIPNVTLQNKHTDTHLKITNIAIKIDPIQLLINKTRISAIGLTGLTVNSEVFKELTENFRKIKFENFYPTNTINLEIRNAEIGYVDAKDKEYGLTNLNARVIGYRVGSPFTINAEGQLSQNDITSKIQLKSLVTVSPENIKLRNSHLKATTTTPSGHLRLIMDSNTTYEYATNTLHTADIIGFLNNSEFMGTISTNFDKKTTEGSINVLTFSLKNFIHAIDKRIQLNDRIEPYNTKAQINIKNDIIKINTKIDESKIQSTLFIGKEQNKLVSSANKISIKRDDLKLFYFLLELDANRDFIAETEIKELTYENLIAKKCTLTSTKNNTNSTTEINVKDFYNGTLNAKFEHDLKNNRLTTKVKSAQITPILQDTGITNEPISGTLDITSEISGNGASLEHFYSSMHGPVIAKLKNGHLSRDINPTTLLMNNLTSNDIKISRPAIFNKIKSECYYNNEVLNCSLLKIKTPTSTMTGMTKFNFNNHNLQAYLNLNELEKTKVTPLTIKYSGNINNIKTAIDFEMPHSSTSSILGSYSEKTPIK